MQTDTSSNHDIISSDRVEGTSVYNAAGDKLGSVNDLMIDKRTGQVRYVEMEFGGFLGMGTDRYPVPWNMLKYDTDKGGYVVPLDKERLKDAPRHEQNDRSSYTDEYGLTIDRYYGL